MKIAVYNQTGKEVEKVDLPKEIFEVKMNQDLIHQVLVSQQANKRQGTAHTKDRGEVSGGGRKPWRQKGTGRARHGSIRSPIWIGGGVTFGPRKDKNYKKIIPKKMRRKALFMVLSAKVKENWLFVLDKLELKEKKTKQAYELLENLRKTLKSSRSARTTGQEIKEFEKGSVLIALPKKDDDAILSFRNIPKVQTTQTKDLNVLDLLAYKYLILPKESIEVIKETFLKISN